MTTIIILLIIVIVAAYIYSRRYRIKTFVENVKASYAKKMTNKKIGTIGIAVASITGAALLFGVFDTEAVKLLNKLFALGIYVATIEFYSHYFINKDEDVDATIIRSPSAIAVRVGLFGLGAAFIIANV